jgi:hypothetical protein
VIKKSIAVGDTVEQRAKHRSPFLNSHAARLN